MISMILRALRGERARGPADFPELAARAVFPNGGVLMCSVCRAQQDFTFEQAADYLRSGWPKHCGETMTLDGRR